MKNEKRKTKNFALIGKRLDYSFSKDYHTSQFEQNNIDAAYVNIELDNLDKLKETISKKNISGFNITNPYKKTILELANELTVTVKEIGAANCIEIKENGNWIAHNTDVIGFEKSLLNLIKYDKPKALIFGTGGASKAIQFVLKKLNTPFQLVSRKESFDSIQYQDLNKTVIEKHRLLINTTPVGTYPNIKDCINLPFEFITSDHFCFDLVYNPEKSEFLKRAQDQGASIKNGQEMLEIQADESRKIWRKTLQTL